MLTLDKHNFHGPFLGYGINMDFSGQKVNGRSMKRGEAHSGKGNPRSDRYAIIFTICWITGFVLLLAWCTSAQAQGDDDEAFAPKTHVLTGLVHCSYLHDLNTINGSVSNVLLISKNHLT